MFSTRAIHVYLGLSVLVLSLIMAGAKLPERWARITAVLVAIFSLLLLWPSAQIYLGLYQQTKQFILQGPRPWAHTVVMETKEHWSLLVPVMALTAAGLVFSGKMAESKRWYLVLVVSAGLIWLMGKIVISGYG